MGDEATLELIRQATFDPGRFVAREKHPDGEPDALYVWQAKAVYSALFEPVPSTEGETE